ncbi:Hypothetical protein Minf_0279 [Methylacidiphilum infernorum V4]|uniref:Uncharacterized protein n=1 Tax=Methylacidiphilum infernorum (isolate V4) TaxID=481448 RepID=B3DY62_METI4|nr:Hypothetical protein Minf_0279 [Methylacidiphilum infernorum V4]
MIKGWRDRGGTMRLGSLGSVDYEDRDLGPAKLTL